MFKFECEPKFSFFCDELPKRGLKGSYGEYIFNFIRTKQSRETSSRPNGHSSERW